MNLQSSLPHGFSISALESPLAWEEFRPYLAVLASVLIQKDEMVRSLASKIDADDIVQETLLKAWQNREKFKGAAKGECLAWLRSILSNVLVDHIRTFLSAKRNVKLEVRINLDQTSRNLESWLVARDPVTPSTRMGREEEMRLLCDAIMRLRPVAKSIILARHIEGLTLNQIAARLSKKRETVAKAWSRAVRQLHEMMADCRG